MKDVNLSLEIKREQPENMPMLATPGEAKSDTEVKTEYPHFHYEGEDELPIPERGVMVVEYEIVFKEETEKKEGEETCHHYICKVDLKKILSVEKSKDERPSKRDTSAEDALDRLMRERMQEDEDEEDKEEGEE